MTFWRWVAVVLLAVTLQWMLSGVSIVVVWEDWSYILAVHGLHLHCSPLLDCSVAFG